MYLDNYLTNLFIVYLTGWVDSIENKLCAVYNENILFNMLIIKL